jgi:hypothetical protein
MSAISRMSHRWPIASSYTPVNKPSHENTRSRQVNTAKILTVHIDGYMRRTRQPVFVLTFPYGERMSVPGPLYENYLSLYEINIRARYTVKML